MCPGFAATPGLVRIVVPEGLNNRGVFALISKMSCMSSSSSPLRVRLPVIMSYSQNQWLHVLARLFSSSIDPSQRRDDQDDVRPTVLHPSSHFPPLVCPTSNRTP